MNIPDVILQLRKLADEADEQTEDDKDSPGIDDYGECRYQEGLRDGFERAIQILEGRG